LATNVASGPDESLTALKFVPGVLGIGRPVNIGHAEERRAKPASAILSPEPSVLVSAFTAFVRRYNGFRAVRKKEELHALFT
jgi:hypothetical protein